MDISALFEAELDARGFGYRIDPASGRHVVSVPNGELVVSLENLGRGLDTAPDATDRVRRFVDTIVRARSRTNSGLRGCTGA